LAAQQHGPATDRNQFVSVRGENSLFFQPSASLPLEKVPVNPRRLDAARIIRPGAVHR
jgi:hypothetical protein